MIKGGVAARLSLLAWWILLALLAVVAVGIGLDRATYRSAQLAAYVPAPFRTFALRQLTSDAIARRLTTARALAREQVQRRPVPAESLSDLALAAVNHGDNALAESAFGLAAGRGWREPLTQQLAGLSAMSNGDEIAAGERTAALWLTQVESPAVAALTEQILAKPAAQREFGRRIAWSQQTVATFLEWAGENLPASELGGTVKALRANGANIDCEQLSTQARQLAEGGEAEEAATLWSSGCGRGALVRSSDFSFHSDDEQVSGPFDWSYPDAVGLNRSFMKLGSAFELHYENSSPLRVVLAERTATLVPGLYHVRALGTGRVPGLLQLIIRCASEDQSPFVFRVPIDDRGSSFTIPAQCQTQELRIMAMPGRGALEGLSLN